MSFVHAFTSQDDKHSVLCGNNVHESLLCDQNLHSIPGWCTSCHNWSEAARSSLIAFRLLSNVLPKSTCLIIPDWLGFTGTLFEFHKPNALGLRKLSWFLAPYLYSCYSLTYLSASDFKLLGLLTTFLDCAYLDLRQFTWLCFPAARVLM